MPGAMHSDLPPRPAKPLLPCVPFLPQDNDAAACDPSASAVVALLNDRLGALLRFDAPTFWAHIAHDASIAHALDTYLQFRRRPHDVPIDGNANVTSAEEDALAKRVFLTYKRVGDQNEPNAPSLSVRSRIVHDRDLVDPAKTLDLCVLYAPDNPKHTEALLANLAATHDALAFAFRSDSDQTRNDASPSSSSSLRRRYETLGDKFASAGAAIANNLEQMADRVVASAIDEVPLSRDSRTDALKYFHDVAASLAALAFHAPALARRCKGDAAAEETSSKSYSKSMPTKNATAGSEDTTCTPLVTAAASLNDSKGKAPVKPTEILSLPDTSTSGDLGFVTCAPEALCDALERVARETCDALRLSQNQKPSSSSSSSSSIDGIQKGEADPADAVRLAVLRGRDALLALDDAAENNTIDDDDDDVDAPPPDDALAAKLRELNELFPEYGDGYLAAALDAFGGDVNDTASRLFEGDLTPALAALDARTSWRARWAAQNPKLKNKNDTGRVSASGPSHTSSHGALSSAWTKKPSSSDSRDKSASPPGREYHKNGDVAYMTRRQKSAYGLESGYDASEAKRRILDLAYDDEYDDSFDELNELAGVAADAGETYEKEKKNSLLSANGVFGAGTYGGSIWSSAGSGSPSVGRVTEKGKENSPKKTFWIENGRVYHAPRAGATAVAASSVEEASALAAAEAAASAERVHGLGAGGNRAAFGATGTAATDAAASAARGGGRGGRGAPPRPPSDLTRPDPRPPPGSGAGPNRRGAGAPPGTRAHKSEHKASIGNHNRKQQAAKKMSRGFGPASAGD